MVSLSQIIPYGMLSKSQMMTLLLICFRCGNQVSQTFTIAQLTKHQG